MCFVYPTVFNLSDSRFVDGVNLGAFYSTDVYFHTALTLDKEPKDSKSKTQKLN